MSIDVVCQLRLLKTSINNAVNRAKEIQKDSKKNPIGREIALAITQLETAEMWTSKAEGLCNEKKE